MRLAQRLELQSYTESDANYWDAAAPETWSVYRRCWGNVRAANGREVIRDGVDAVVDAVVTIRHPHEGRIPQATDRVIFDEGGTERTLNITHVKRADERRRMLELHCQEDVT